MATKKKRGGRNTPEHNKAARLRRKIRAGKELAVEDLEWLRAYELNKKAPGRPVQPGAEIGEASDVDVDDDDDDTATDPEPEPDLEPAPDPAPPLDVPAATPTPTPTPTPRAQLPPAPPLEVPPRVRVDPKEPSDGKRKSAEDWRDRYRGENKTASREGTVLLVAEQWCGVLDAMASQMRDVGVDPIVDPASLRPAIVLFLDDVLPEIEITPMHLAVGGTSALMIQRFMKRKEIGEHIERERDKADHARTNAERRERTERAQAAADELRANAAKVEAEQATQPAPEPVSEPESIKPFGETPIVVVEIDDDVRNNPAAVF